MANRATKLATFTTTATGDGQVFAMLRDQSGVLVVEYDGTLGTFTVIIEGRAVPGTGGWALITQKTQADVNATNMATAAAVTLMPEMRARCTVYTGGSQTAVRAYIVQ